MAATLRGGPRERHLGDQRVADAHQRGALEVVERVRWPGLRFHADGMPGLVVEDDMVTGAGHGHLEGTRPGEPGGPRDGGEAVVPRAVGRRRLDEAERD